MAHNGRTDIIKAGDPFKGTPDVTVFVDAVQWSLVGAVLKVSGSGAFPNDLACDMLAELQKTVAAPRPVTKLEVEQSFNWLADFNDHIEIELVPREGKSDARVQCPVLLEDVLQVVIDTVGRLESENAVPA